ncbi:MAG: DUF3551 domain-containing protein [Rhodopseudomonas sp.]|nr:DUF3551 domain-containing protein [Rhodopseudomonas sp.]
MQLKTCVVLLGLVTAGAVGANHVMAATAAPAGAEAWCGFHDKSGSLVRCGYTSAAECKENVVGKDAVCMPDPYMAMRSDDIAIDAS